MWCIIQKSRLFKHYCTLLNMGGSVTFTNELFVHQDAKFFLHRELMKELSLCIQKKDHKEATLIIRTIGKSIGRIKSPHIFKKQILLKPTTTRHDSVEEQLKRMAEVYCSHRSSYSNHIRGTNIIISNCGVVCSSFR